MAKMTEQQIMERKKALELQVALAFDLFMRDTGVVVTDVVCRLERQTPDGYAYHSVSIS